jgi:hypothetical protein
MPNRVHSCAAPLRNRLQKPTIASGAGHAAWRRNAGGLRLASRADGRRAIVCLAREPRSPPPSARVGRYRLARAPAWQVAAVLGLTLAAVTLQTMPAAGLAPLADRCSAENGQESQHLWPFCRTRAVLPTPALTPDSLGRPPTACTGTGSGAMVMPGRRAPAAACYPVRLGLAWLPRTRTVGGRTLHGRPQGENHRRGGGGQSALNTAPLNPRGACTTFLPPQNLLRS